MPRDGNGVFQDLPGLEGVPNQTIESADWNNYRADIAQDLNAARPITAGGTGATSPIGATDNITTKGANIAAAANLNLNNATGYFVEVTGNTGITAVTLNDGRQRMVRFTGTPLITVGANLVGNNGGQNIQIEAGDMAVFEGYASNVVRFWLTRASGAPVSYTLTSTDPSATAGPTFDLVRDSASPANGDDLGVFRFRGKNATVLVDYARIFGGIQQLGVNDEVGEINFTFRNVNNFGNPAEYTMTWSRAPSIPAAALMLPNEAGVYWTNGSIRSGLGGSDIIHTSTTGHFFIGAVQVNTSLQIGSFSATGAGGAKIFSPAFFQSSRNTAANTGHQQFYNPNGLIGSITTSSSATAFNTSSDELLKDFLGVYDPLEAMAIIRADPTRRFAWKIDGSVAVGWGAQTSYAVSHDLATPGGWFDRTSGLSCDEHDENAAYRPWGVDQAKRTPYLWAVVPWLADRLDAVEARLSAAGL